MNWLDETKKLNKKSSSFKREREREKFLFKLCINRERHKRTDGVDGYNDRKRA